MKASVWGRGEREGSGFCFHCMSNVKTFWCSAGKIVSAEETYLHFAVLQSFNTGVEGREDLQRTMLF